MLLLQVYELHRLYRVQKILMRSINNNRPNSRTQNGFSFHKEQAQVQKSMVKLDLERPAEEYVAESNGGHRELQLIDENEIELTLGPSSYKNRKKKPETPLTSDSGPSFSSSSTGSSQINRTSSLTNQTTNKTRDDQLTGRQTEPGRGRKVTDIDEDQLRQERIKQPPWLFQVLSLNMT